MSIEYSFPSELMIADGMTRGEKRPGSQFKRFVSGKIGGRDFSEREVATFDISLIDLRKDDDTLRQLIGFSRHVKIQVSKFWLTEAIKKTHSRVLCDTVGDGTRTTFILPVKPTDAAALAAAHVFVAGAPQFSGYAFHAVSNLLTDDQASAVDGITGSELVGAAGTLSQTDMVSADGLTCFKIVPSASGAHGVQQTDATCVAAVPGDIFTAHSALRGAGTFRVGIEYLTAGYATVGSIQYSSTFTGSETDWTVATKTYTAPATTAFVRAIGERSSSSTAVLFADCLGVHPGDLTRWFLPSAAPPAIEFSSAVALNSRVEASCAGQLIALVRIMQNGISWSEIIEGDSITNKISIEQDFE